MKKATILFVLALVLSLTLSVFAYDNVYLYDNEGLLNDAVAVNEKMEAIYNKTGLLTVAVTESNGAAVISRLPNFAGGALDMVLLHIDMGTREFNLYQYNSETGESSFRITNSESDDILDAVLPYAKKGDWDRAIITFAEMSSDAFANSSNFNSAKDTYGDYGYTDYAGSEPKTISEAVLSSLPLAIFLGVIAGAVAVIIVCVSYKTKQRGKTYPLDEYSNFEVTASKDNFINKSVVVTHIPDPPASSGGSRGGSRGGGGHMGGRSF